MATTDVLSLDEAMTAISMTGSGARHAAQVALFVSAVSELLDSIVGPIVYRTITNEPHDTDGLIVLNYQPVAAITSVTEYQSGSPSVLTAETSTVSGGYLLRNGMLARRSGFSTTRWYGPVAVTYTAGRYADTASVGAKFKLTAMEIVSSEWQNYAAAWTRGDPFAAPDGGGLYGESVQKIVNKFLADERRAPTIA